jgi:hypothetical protein
MEKSWGGKRSMLLNCRKRPCDNVMPCNTPHATAQGVSYLKARHELHVLGQAADFVVVQ